MTESNPWANEKSRPSSSSPEPPPSSNRIDVLLVFIHGFKGSSQTTFSDFPSRLAHLVNETYPSSVRVTPLIYPTYATRGSLAVAVEGFTDWLTQQVLHLETGSGEIIAHGEQKAITSGLPGGKGSVKVILAGHSMGGLVASDAALKIANESTDGDPANGPIWPRVAAVLAYDSPFYGVHPNVFKNQASKYITYAQQARDMGAHFAPVGAGSAAAWGMNKNSSNTRTSSNASSSSGWSKLAGLMGGAATKTAASNAATKEAPDTPASSSGSGWTNALWATGVLATAATASGVAAYYNREQIGGAYSWLTDHFEYVSNLWDDAALRQRLNNLVDLPSIFFHSYYNHLPSSKSTGQSKARTFLILPPLSSPASPLFTPIHNTVARDEIEAHITMFDSSPQGAGAGVVGELVRQSAECIGEVIEVLKKEQQDDQVEDKSPPDSAGEEKSKSKKKPTKAKRRSRGGDMSKGQRKMERESTVGSSHGTANDQDEEGLRFGSVGLEEEEREVIRGREQSQREVEEAMSQQEKE